MFQKIFAAFAIVAAVTMIGLAAVAVTTRSHRPTPPQAQNYIDFADRYAEADADYRLDDLQKKVVGEKVDWVGVVETVSHTGTSFYMQTIPNHGCHCFVVLNQGWPLKNLKPGITYVHVKGRIDHVTVLGVIVEGCIIEEIY